MSERNLRPGEWNDRREWRLEPEGTGRYCFQNRLRFLTTLYIGAIII